MKDGRGRPPKEENKAVRFNFSIEPNLLAIAKAKAKLKGLKMSQYIQNLIKADNES